jgi:hypothetical protein
MGYMMSMGHRQRRTGAEWDAFSRFGRKYLAYLQRAGVRSSIKRDARRRDRHEARDAIRRSAA